MDETDQWRICLKLSLEVKIPSKPTALCLPSSTFLSLFLSIFSPFSHLRPALLQGSIAASEKLLM